MLSITLLLLHFFLFIRPSYSQSHMHAYLSSLSSFLLFFFLLLLLGILSIRRILLPLTPSCLTSTSLRYIPSFCMHSCCHVSPGALFFFFLFSFLYISPFTLSSSLIFFLFFFRPTLSPFLFITLRVKRSPLPQAHP